MKTKTSELIGPALDWAVAKCEHKHVRFWPDGRVQYLHPNTEWTDFVIDWSQGGQIIEREKISPCFSHEYGDWWATTGDFTEEATLGYRGDTPLIAAMRCYVASKLGETVEIPEELLA